MRRSGSCCCRAPGSTSSTRRRVIAWTHHERYDGTATRGGWPATRSRWPGGSPRWPTRSTRSAPTACTGARCRSPTPWRSGEERGRQFDPGSSTSSWTSWTRCGDHGPLRRRPRRAAHVREPELVTLQEAAGTLGVTQSRLRRWSDEGRIEAVRTAGGHRRFPRRRRPPAGGSELGVAPGCAAGCAAGVRAADAGRAAHRGREGPRVRRRRLALPRRPARLVRLGGRRATARSVAA